MEIRDGKFNLITEVTCVDEIDSRMNCYFESEFNNSIDFRQFYKKSENPLLIYNNLQLQGSVILMDHLTRSPSRSIYMPTPTTNIKPKRISDSITVPASTTVVFLPFPQFDKMLY